MTRGRVFAAFQRDIVPVLYRYGQAIAAFRVQVDAFVDLKAREAKVFTLPDPLIRTLT
jgi:hypothetical protein